MNKGLRLALCTGALAAFASGCIVVSSVERPVVRAKPGSPEAVLCAEIDAAGKLDFDSSRTAALNTIAARTNLPSIVQVHLVNTTVRRLGFENSQVAVFNTLIRNDSFSNAAKQRILEVLPSLHFDSNKAALLRLLDKRGPLKV